MAIDTAILKSFCVFAVIFLQCLHTDHIGLIDVLPVGDGEMKPGPSHTR